MRILYASDSYHPKNDGVVRYIDETSRLLAEKHEVGVIAPTFRAKGDDDPNWVDIHRLKSIDIEFHGYGFTFPAYGEAKKVVLDYDLVFVQSIAPLGSISLLAAKHNRKPLVAFLHCMESVSMGAAYGPLFAPWKGLMDFYSQRLYMRCDSLLLESRTVAHELERIGIKKYERIPFGIDHQRFNPDRESQFDFGLPDDKPIVVFAGRLSFQKGIDILVDIIDSLREDVHFLVVGDGPQREYVEEMNTPNLTYVGGFLSNIEDAFSSGDMFLFIGNEYRRDLTMICYEALASGLPVLAPDFGYDSIFTGGHNCVLKERSAPSLVEGIKELLDSSRRREMSRNAVESVRELTWPNYVTQLEAILERTREDFQRSHE
ncbi:MAG: glycosyltransferase [Theionarchaea archaeon]|nr:glycosyltransferase [Theionarchaea archaeon]